MDGRIDGQRGVYAFELRQTADRSHHATRIFRLSAVREKLRWLAGRTKTGIEDAVTCNARLFHLTPVRLRKIEFALPAGWFPLRKKLCKVIRDLRAHFIAAVPDRWPHSGVNVAWRSCKIGSHFLNRVFHHFTSRPAPPCMHRGYRAVARIKQQNRYAIGRSNGNVFSDLVRN